MAVLKNPKHEAFAQGLAKGLSASAAYVGAGYKKNDGNAVRLKGNEKVEARVAEIVGKGAEAAEVTVARTLTELARIGFSDIRRLFSESGNLLNPSDWPDDIAAAVASIEVVVKPGGFDEDGNREVEHVHKIKVWDKNTALGNIAKHLGMLVEKHEHTGKDGGPIETTDMTAIEAARQVAFTLARGAKEIGNDG